MSKVEPLYHILRREKSKETRFKWSSWKSFEVYELDEERDFEYEKHLQEGNPLVQYRKDEKYKRGAKLSPEQKEFLTKGSGPYLLQYREFDKQNRKLSTWKLMWKFETPEARQYYYGRLVLEEREGKIFRMKTAR